MEEYTKFFTEFEKEFKGFDHAKKFNLLIKTGLGWRETLHSNLIADFLNLNPRYLELFLKEINVPGFYDYDKIKIYRELPTKGFIDIYIVNQHNNKAIIIENKVNDPGKSGQLKKYYDDLVEKYPKGVTAIYLTKYGNLPPNDALCEHKCISYEKHIVGWLEECIKETDNHRIKESLEIYVELVRSIINRDKYMEKVFDYLRENNNMSLAIAIYKTLNGRNFFQDKEFLGRIQSLFLEGFKEIGLDLNETAWWEVKSKVGVWGITIIDEDEVEIGAFYIDANEICAYTPDHQEIKSAQIIGKDLLNENLQALLTKDKSKINLYLKQCIAEMEEIRDTQLQSSTKAI